jgi:hypothetical protein
MLISLAARSGVQKRLLKARRTLISLDACAASTRRCFSPSDLGALSSIDDVIQKAGQQLLFPTHELKMLAGRRHCFAERRDNARAKYRS